MNCFAGQVRYCTFFGMNGAEYDIEGNYILFTTSRANTEIQDTCNCIYVMQCPLKLAEKLNMLDNKLLKQN